MMNKNGKLFIIVIKNMKYRLDIFINSIYSSSLKIIIILLVGTSRMAWFASMGSG